MYMYFNTFKSKPECLQAGAEAHTQENGDSVPRSWFCAGPGSCAEPSAGWEEAS